MCWVHCWNTQRLHSELSYHTPEESDNQYWHTYTSSTYNNELAATHEQNPGRFNLGTQIDLGAIQNLAITPPALPFTGGSSADTFFIVGGGILAAALLAAGYRRRQADA